tara:strand:+ start:92 stop:358 length:267 start_codon:yes stop_codon:yes gene_type:complete
MIEMKSAKPNNKQNPLCDIIEILTEAANAGLKVFVEDHKLMKVVEILHVFNEDKINKPILPPVLITIEPITDESKLYEIEISERNSIN